MIRYIENCVRGEVSRAHELAQRLNVSKIVAQLLCMRGYDDEKSAAAFLDPDIEDMHDPFLFSEMQDAVDCLCAARSMDERVCVYGDYDVDGICGVSILTRYLKSEGFDVFPYIPSRHIEGYGLNMSAIEKIAQMGASLLVTVDCGITAHAEIERAYELGMEVVLTDHHQCLDTLPECAAVINPARKDGYPFSYLCGAGVALKLVQAMGGIEAAKRYIDLASIATVSDIVSLTGENRIIVCEGLKNINAGKCCAGVKAIADISGYKSKTLGATGIGFGIAPRINAMGRIGSAEDSLALFLSDDMGEAEKLAAKLDKENRNRQQIEAEIMEQALEKIDAREVDIERDCAIVLFDERWNPGIIGIVASRLVRRFYKPVILLAGENGACSGSGRSIQGVHMFETLNHFSDMFIRFGGHEMAAGLTIEREKIEEFRALLNQYLISQTPPEVFVPCALYDLKASCSDMTLDLAEKLAALEPFGIGNPPPVFRIDGVNPQNCRVMGSDGSHLKFTSGNVEFVAFAQGHALKDMVGRPQDILINLEINEWQNSRTPRCNVKFMRARFPSDIGAYIGERSWNFSDAFFERIRYNIEIGYNKNCNIGSNLQYADPQLMRAEIKKWLCEWPQGALLIAHTPKGAADALKWLESEGLGEEIDICWREVSGECAYNTLLLAPDCSRQLERFNRIVFFDGLTDGRAVSLCDNDAQLLVSSENCEDFFRSLKYEREDLVPLYKAVKALCTKQTTFLDASAYIRELNGVYPCSQDKARFALRVFEELEFMTIERSGCFKVTAQQTPKRDLSESRTFDAAKRAFELSIAIVN